MVIGLFVATNNKHKWFRQALRRILFARGFPMLRCCKWRAFGKHKVRRLAIKCILYEQTPFQLSTNIIPFQCWYINDYILNDYILKAILTNFSALSASSCETYDYPRLTAKTEGRSMESVNDGFSSYLVGMHNYIFTAQYAHCCPEPLTSEYYHVFCILMYRLSCKPDFCGWIIISLHPCSVNPAATSRICIVHSQRKMIKPCWSQMQMSYKSVMSQLLPYLPLINFIFMECRILCFLKIVWIAQITFF